MFAILARTNLRSSNFSEHNLFKDILPLVSRSYATIVFTYKIHTNRGGKRINTFPNLMTKSSGLSAEDAFSSFISTDKNKEIM